MEFYTHVSEGKTKPQKLIILDSDICASLFIFKLVRLSSHKP